MASTTAEESPKDASSAKKQACCTRRRACCFGFVFLLVAAGLAVGVYFIFFRKDDPDPIATCGDCHCIVEPGNMTATCPEAPEMDHPDALMDILETQQAVNALTLDCDPYCNNCDCETVPPQEFVGDEEAVCGIHYEVSPGENEDALACVGASYSLVSYTSREEAELAGAFVTHVGACGVCSTTRDLAAYLRSPDLTSDGTFCSKQGVFSFNEGVECYMDLGFTESCARMWTYNGLNTARECLGTCVFNLNKPNNGPPPFCALNDCLECDEIESGPIFKQYAGRTRRGSGILSAIARPCDDIVSIAQEACPSTEPLE